MNKQNGMSLATFYQVGKCPICKTDVLNWMEHLETKHQGVIAYHITKQICKLQLVKNE